MQKYEVWVYLRERPFPGLKANIRLVSNAGTAHVDQGILYIQNAEDDGPELYAFSMSNVIYWTSTPINDSDNDQETED